MSTLNTDNFPEISFIDNATVEDVLTQMIADYGEKYEEITGEKASLAQANPYRLIMYAASLQIYQAMQYADYAGKMSFLTYAQGDYLDNLAALRGIHRKEATAARTVLKFSIDEEITQAIAIPAGTRVMNASGVYFSTDEYAEIAAGETETEVTATCTEAGEAGNGYAAGEISTLVNTIAYITAVSNTATTYGGADIESDDDLKERIYESPNGYSVAGSSGAYAYHTKNAVSGIGDVVVKSDSPGEVDIYFIMDDGTLPSAAVIAEVAAYLDSRTIRPLTDKVTVQAPSVAEYDIELTYYIASSDTASVTAIQEGVSAAVSAYNLWQTGKIGRDINPSVLIQKIVAAGAKRVAVTSPTFAVINESTIAQTGNVTVNYGGVEDD